MATKIEYQVVDSEDVGNEVRSYKTFGEAKKDYEKNKNAIELRKVIWKIQKDEKWETAAEADREENVIRFRFRMKSD